jgi:poly(3-hydroxybutyrate) depolymerase
MTNHHVSAVAKLLVALLLHVTFSIGHASAQSLTQTGITKNVNYAIGGYYECLPPDYTANSTKKYPLMIFIHGIGELGDGSQAELPRVLKFGIPKLIDRNLFPSTFTVGGQTSSFIVISPQFRDNHRDADAVKTLIDYCVANYRVDESRIYLTGLSMGGGISWIYAGKSVANAQRLAAMMVVCGNTNSSTTGINNLVAASLPVWATHNSNDPIVGSYNSINWINGLNGHSPAIKPKALLNIFNSTSHDAWTKTYDPAFKPNGLNVYEWMLSHKRTTATPANLTPTVSAGADKTITLPANDFTLSGTASDVDGSISQYQWTKVAGPVGGSITSPATAQTTIADVTEGIYTYRLTVKDNNGATAYDDVKITVNAAANLEPLANAGNDTTVTLPIGGVNLRGSGTDPDGTIETYVWTKVSGPAQGTIANINAAHTTVSGLAPGVYTFRLSVTDNNGATTTDEVIITVKDATMAIARAGRDTVVYKNQTQPDNVVLNGRASMGGTSYEWTQISGPVASQIADATAAETYVSNLEEGTYLFKLTVNGNASDTMKVFVRDWQKKNVNPCRPGGGKAFIVPENYPGQYTRLYFNRDNVLGEKIMGGDTLYFKGGTYSAFEIGDFGGGEGCPVYLMPKDKPLVIIDGYFRIGVRDSNVVQYAVMVPTCAAKATRMAFSSTTAQRPKKKTTIRAWLPAGYLTLR